jgi:hypothetical protein
MWSFGEGTLFREYYEKGGKKEKKKKKKIISLGYSE